MTRNEGNDEVRMTNDELMTKSGTPRDEFDDEFWERRTAPMIREEPETQHVFMIWKNERHDSVKQ